MRTAAEGAFLRAWDLSSAAGAARTGFYAGSAGIGSAFARAAVLLNSEQWASAAEAVVGPLVDADGFGEMCDVIDGIAGSVIGLCVVGETLNSDTCRRAAGALADRLIETANRGASGWSWPGGRLRARNLTGFSHGTAGVAYALLEAFRLTGDQRYQFAARQAFAYERHAFDVAAQNWPDYRVREYGIHGALAREEFEEILVRHAPFAPEFMSAWCHGAPGIGLARLHGWRVLGDDRCRDEAAIAIRTTRESLPEQRNMSLCHGALGNCETLLSAGEILGDAHSEAVARQFAAAAYESYEEAGCPWPTGRRDAAADPSLMLGDAGIGYTYLRLAACGTPSILAPTARVVGPPSRLSEPDSRIRHSYWREHFGATLRRLDRRQACGDEIRIDERSPTDLASLVEALDACLSQPASTPEGALTRDCFAFERRLYELAMTPSYLPDEILASRKARQHAGISLGTVALKLAPGVEIRTAQRDWLDSNGDSEVATTPLTILLFQCEGRWRARLLNPFSTLVLGKLKNPVMAQEIVEQVRNGLDQETAVHACRAAVHGQLRAAIAAGLVSIVPASTDVIPVHANAC